MGLHHENGYSASVEGFFVFNGERIRVAKSSHSYFYAVEPRDLPAGVEGDLLVIVDGNSSSRRVRLPLGMQANQLPTQYEVAARI